MPKTIESRRVFADLLAAIKQAIFLTGVSSVNRGVKKGVTLAKNVATELAQIATEYCLTHTIS